jgi:hypothetical protein
MDNKGLIPVLAIALLACVALMLTVIGGLYTYNTFVASPQAAYAQSAGTDRGPYWTVTPVTVGGNQQYVVVIKEDDNAYEAGVKSLHMAVYEFNPSGQGRTELYFVAARVLEWDTKVPDHSGANTRSGWKPDDVRKALRKR